MWTIQSRHDKRNHRQMTQREGFLVGSSKHSQVINRMAHAIVRQSSLRDMAEAQPYLELWEAVIRAGISDFLLGKRDGYPSGSLHEHTFVIDVDGSWAERFVLKSATRYWDAVDDSKRADVIPIVHTTGSSDRKRNKYIRPVRSATVVPWPGHKRAAVGV